MVETAKGLTNTSTPQVVGGNNPLMGDLLSEMRAYDNVEVFWEKPLDVHWLWPKQKDILKTFYDKEKKFRELILVAGMRSGKTTTASVIATYELYKLLAIGNPCQKYGLPRGSEIFIINVAHSAQQARDTVFAQIKARIENSPWLQRRKYIEHFNEFIFPAGDGNVVVRSEHSNSASLVGKTSICVLLDELARFKEEGGKSSAKEIYNALKRSTRTFGDDGRLVSISSPVFVDDYQMQLYRSGVASKSGQILALRYPTWEMNPNISFESLQDEFDRDPESAWRDYGAVPSSALERYLKEDAKIDEALYGALPHLVTTDDGIVRFTGELDPAYTYVLAGDPAVKNDAFGLGLVHRDSAGYMVVDVASHIKPRRLEDSREKEINAQEVKRFVGEIMKKGRISAFVTDTWMFPETIQGIRDMGIPVVQNVVTKVQYDYFKELIYTGKVRICDSPELVQELKQLELHQGKRIDHPRTGSKDIADAVANALWVEKTYTGYAEEPVWVVT